MFGKIFDQIYDSSIAEDWTVRVVFQDFIVLADVNGVVDKTPEAISRRTNVPIETVKRAIAILEAPDPLSRTPEEGGARIKRLDAHREWGWWIVNYARFRDTASEQQRREKTLARVHKFRMKRTVTHCNAGVTQVNASNAMQKQKQKKKEEGDFVAVFPDHLDTEPFRQTWKEWETARKAMKKAKNWHSLFSHQMKLLGKYDASTAIEILEKSLRNGWQGIFPPSDSGNAHPTQSDSETREQYNARILRESIQ